MCQGFSRFVGFLHHFVLAKLANSSMRVKPPGSFLKQVCNVGNYRKRAALEGSMKFREGNMLHRMSMALITIIGSPLAHYRKCADRVPYKEDPGCGVVASVLHCAVAVFPA